MFAVDVLYWASLFLGASYVALTLALGGVSHILGSVQHAFDTGDAGAGADIGHVDTSGDIGHADIGHADVGHADIGHADFGQADVGHGVTDTGHADLGGGDAGHVDLGHDAGDPGYHAGDLGHDPSGADAGHADVGHAGHADHGAPVKHVNILAFLNPTMASSFLVGFGGVGVLSRVTGAGMLPSMAYAGLGGGIFYYSAWWTIVRFFGGAQSSSHTRRRDLIGVRATVTAPIEGSRPGMIAYTLAGSRQVRRAVTYENESLPVGEAVRIRRLTGDSALVSRIEG